MALSQAAVAQVVAFDMVGSANQNLTSFTNPWNGAFGSAGDGFQKYRRGVSPSIPFAVLDDSLSIFPADSLGVIKDGNLDEFFGVVDTINSQNPSGPVEAIWEFDISGATGLVIAIDMGAMGDFESSDGFSWTYSIDGGPALTAFSSTVDEAISHTYTLEGGATFTLNDPMLMQGNILTNDLATFSAPLVGTGSTLTLTLSATFNGGSETVAFQNIVISEGDVPPPPPSELEIFEIQGDGAASPVEGNVVTTLDNVVTTIAPDGFFIQTPAARADGDINTSDGIFVFTGAAPGVSAGDLVDVTGEVDEFFGFTEIKNATVTVDGTGVVPAAVTFDAAVPSPDAYLPSCSIEFECYEGMLVEITDGTVTGPNQRFGSDPIAEVHITAAPARAFREPGIESPGLFGYPEWDGNPEVFELDPDKLGLANQTIPAGSSFSATGVLGFEFGGYELWPSALTVVPAPLPVPVRSRLNGEMTVGTLNLFRLFNDIDDPMDLAADGRERNDSIVSTAEYERRLVKFAEHIVGVLNAPDVLAVQEVESLTVLQDLAAEIALIDASVDYSAYLVEGNDLGTIDVGFLTRAHIQVEAITQLGKNEYYTNPINDQEEILHDRPPLLLEGYSQLEYGAFPISVLAVHNRSLGGIEGSQASRVRQKRYDQAVSIADKIQAIQVADPDVRLVVTGDFNAFEFTDGYVDAVNIIRGDFDPLENLVCETNSCTDIVEPNFTNEVLGMPAEYRYSFIFRGSAQVLDHALTSAGLSEEMTGAEFGRGNADAAVEFINDGITPEIVPLRSSDHDGLVVYILNDKDNDGVPNDDDVCPATIIPEGVPTNRLGVNRFALADEDGVFDTTLPKGQGPGQSFTIGDTAGCSCEQIVAAQGLGKGHLKFGCSLGEMEEWVEWVNQP
jgi:predicted extracellular nuclease